MPDAPELRRRWEVIISDNGSTDGTAEVARQWIDRPPGLRVVDASPRKGASHAPKVGAAVARGEFLAYCDADDEVGPGWLAALVETACCADMVGGWLDEFSLRNPRARPDIAHLRDRLDVSGHFQAYCAGGNCGIWASVQGSAGRWNEDYLRANDVQMSWRVFQALACNLRRMR